MTIPQHIDIFNFIKSSSEITDELPIAQLTRMHGDLTSTADFLKIKLQGITSNQNHPLLHIKINGQLQMICQRCLEPLQHQVDVNNTLHFVSSEAELDSEEDELNAIIAGKNEPEKMVGNIEFDLLNLLEDEIILSLPLALTHTTCPKELPTSTGKKASPFDVLAKLK